MKSAFTMIELIFVIVILGILVAVAIPKLVATRDDAKVSRVAMDIATGVGEIVSYVVSKGDIDTNLSKMSNAIASLENSGIAQVDNNKTATVKMGSVSDCVTVKVISGTNEENLSVEYGSSGGDRLCDDLQSIIDKKKYPIKLRGKTVVQ